MCGINGIVTTDRASKRVEVKEVEAIRDSMACRGPDATGLYVSPDGACALGHRRLAIIDLSPGGAQPRASIDGRLKETFNGEIYNYKELRAELEAQGETFESTSDTEVWLRLYQKIGIDAFDRMRGMFAIAIWDEKERTLTCATDPFGIKPLYYSWDGKTLRFASQVKALMVSNEVDKTADPAGHAGFLLWGSVPEPYTMIKGVKALGAGGLLQLDAKTAEIRVSKWCDVARDLAKASQNPERVSDVERNEILRDALRGTVEAHLQADVPVKVFLSAGRDSTTITALAAELIDAPVETTTLGFEEFRGSHRDEVPLAEMVAKHYGTKHQTLWIQGSHFHEDLTRIIHAMDQPTIDAVNTYFVSKVVAETGAKVALSGLGGDELFAGYPSFGQVPKIVRTVGGIGRVPGLARGFRAASSGYFRRKMNPKMAGLLEYGRDYGSAYLLRRGLFMPWELPSVMDPDMAREGWRELQPIARLGETVEGISGEHLRVSALEGSWYMRNMLLRDSDWAGMAHSLELRVPFVDIALWRRLAPLIADKPLTKDDMARTPSKQLPDEILNRKKTGFEIPTYEWLGPYRTRQAGEPKFRAWAREVYFLWHTLGITSGCC